MDIQIIWELTILIASAMNRAQIKLIIGIIVLEITHGKVAKLLLKLNVVIIELNHKI